MTIFISYSHQDSHFVDMLAGNLMRNKARVWIDRWELKIGDSILDKIQDAIEEASALLVILSEASVKSEWCKKELSSGLLRELEEKRVVVLPVLIDKCKVPLFLRGKLYADFRKGFDKGFQDILDSIAGIINDTQGRITTTNQHIDWALEWDVVDDSMIFKFVVVSHAEKDQFSILTEIIIIANETITDWYKKLSENGFDWYVRQHLANVVGQLDRRNDLNVVLSDNMPRTLQFKGGDPRRRAEYQFLVSTRRLGRDVGRDIFVDIGSQFGQIRGAIEANMRVVSREEYERVSELLNEEPFT